MYAIEPPSYHDVFRFLLNLTRCLESSQICCTNLKLSYTWFSNSYLLKKKVVNEFRDHSCFDLMGHKYNIYMYGLKIIHFYNKLLSACMCPVQVCLCETKIDKAMETLYFLMNNDFVGSKSRWIASPLGRNDHGLQ